MRRMSAAAVLLFVGTAAFGEALRSDRHLVKIEVQASSGNARRYDVQVFESDSRKNVTRLNVVTKGDTPAEEETTAGGTRYKVRIEPHGDAYLVAFTADDGTETIDTMSGGFTTAVSKPNTPRRTPRGGRDIDEPKVKRRVDALYTEEARAAGAAGSVIVDLTIDRSGFVREATVVKSMGHGLSEAAVEAAKQWQFEPSTDEGVPVEVAYEVTFDFKPN